ncbi:MAG: carboxypeptidase family protein [Parasphingorhabdus sp.]
MERHADLIAKTLGTGLADLEVLGQTLEGRSLDLLTVGTPSQDKLIFWVTARQHPGETMAEWWIEGFLERLLDLRDEEAIRLRENSVFYIVPNMNPDGSYRGHLRTNAAGVDLNRAWKAPTLDHSPEVFHTRERMFATKPDFILDVHGVESIKHAFIVGPEGPAGLKNPIAQLTDDYKKELGVANIDFQTLAGFDTDPNEADDTIASNFLGEYFGCLCMTLEMPFKDTTHTPDPKYGWSTARSMKMGRDSVTAMANIIDRLREEQKAWR